MCIPVHSFVVENRHSVPIVLTRCKFSTESKIGCDRGRCIDVNTSAAITSDLTLGGEFAASQYDRNRMSVLDNEGMDGYAHSLSVNYSPKAIMIGETEFGDLDFRLSERIVNRTF